MTVEALRAQISVLENEKRSLLERQSTVNAIINRDHREPEDDIVAIRKFSRKTANNILLSVNNSSNFSSLSDRCEDKSANACGLDHWEERSELSKEIARIQQRINDIDYEIHSLWLQIEAEESRDRE